MNNGFSICTIALDGKYSNYIKPELSPTFILELMSNIVMLAYCLFNLYFSFKGILAGDYDQLPEQAFYMVGGIEEAVEKSKKV